jgi:hypothetical protein
MCKSEGKHFCPTGEGRKMRELAGAGVVIEGGESGSLSENSRRQNSDGRVVIVTRVQVGASRERIGFVRLTRNMDQYVVIVCEAGNEASNTSSDILWVGVIFKILVIRIDGDRFGRSA